MEIKNTRWFFFIWHSLDDQTPRLFKKRIDKFEKKTQNNDPWIVARRRPLILKKQHFYPFIWQNVLHISPFRFTNYYFSTSNYVAKRYLLMSISLYGYVSSFQIKEGIRHFSIEINDVTLLDIFHEVLIDK